MVAAATARDDTESVSRLVAVQGGEEPAPLAGETSG